MTPEEHKHLHRKLHHELDQLLACYLSEGFNREDRGGVRASIHDEILDLMQWSAEKTHVPSPCAEDMPHEREGKFLIATNDDPELLEWLAAADRDGGGFVKAIARAGLSADHENYPLIRTLLLVMRRKYPAYEPSDAVKK